MSTWILILTIFLVNTDGNSSSTVVIHTSSLTECNAIAKEHRHAVDATPLYGLRDKKVVWSCTEQKGVVK
jgi:hypothetical protein